MVIKNAASLKAMCVASYPRWSGVSPSDLGISVVGGGLSNLNYRVALADGVALPEEGPREVLLRLFGGGSHELIDREQENVRIWSCGLASCASRPLAKTLDTGLRLCRRRAWPWPASTAWAQRC